MEQPSGRICQIAVNWGFSPTQWTLFGTAIVAFAGAIAAVALQSEKIPALLRESRPRRRKNRPRSAPIARRMPPAGGNSQQLGKRFPFPPPRSPHFPPSKPKSRPILRFPLPRLPRRGPDKRFRGCDGAFRFSASFIFNRKFPFSGPITSQTKGFSFSAPAMSVDVPRKTVSAPNEPRFPSAS